MLTSGVSGVRVSFVIPCFNEEIFIGSTIDSINANFFSKEIPYEIIVVDNRSEDRSALIAIERGAKVVYSESNTVSAVRNDGCRVATGQIFIFLDADVVIDDNWIEIFLEHMERLIRNNDVVGSHCSVPETIKGPLKEWYFRIENDDRDTHIGSGHMLIGRKLFFLLEGFNPSLVSGEDYDLCKRAKAEGAELVVDSRLKAFHLGYPTTIKEFVRREVWHGLGDVQNFQKFIVSKPAVAATLLFLLQALAIISLLNGMMLSFYFLFLTIVAMIIALIVYKF
ncbi:MAG: hypothetical protein COA80_02230, partial [Leeuwenhoekiella sp.]